MKQVLAFLLMFTVSITAALANGTNGTDGSKIEFKVPQEMDAVPVQTPNCGSGGEQNWVDDGIQWLPDGTQGMAQKRDCKAQIPIWVNGVYLGTYEVTIQEIRAKPTPQ